MTQASGIKVYLAGPTVFLPNALEIAEKKKEILIQFGMIGCFPLDNQLVLDGDSLQTMGYKIGRANFAMMDQCDTIIADLTPWHGPSADVGTFGECLYMFAQNKMVNAYSNDGRLFTQRVRDDFYKGQVARNDVGHLIGDDGHMIEEFELADNLMVATAIHESKGEFLRIETSSEQRYTNLIGFKGVVALVAEKYKNLKLGVA